MERNELYKYHSSLYEVSFRRPPDDRRPSLSNKEQKIKFFQILLGRHLHPDLLSRTTPNHLYNEPTDHPHFTKLSHVYYISLSAPDFLVNYPKCVVRTSGGGPLPVGEER